MLHVYYPSGEIIFLGLVVLLKNCLSVSTKRTVVEEKPIIIFLLFLVIHCFRLACLLPKRSHYLLAALFVAELVNGVRAKRAVAEVKPVIICILFFIYCSSLHVYCQSEVTVISGLVLGRNI